MAHVAVKKDFPITGQATNNEAGEGIHKAYIPGFLYKPPYGYPLNKNIGLIKQLAFNPYIFSIKRTIKDQIASTKWDIKLKEEYQTNDKDDKVDVSQFEEQRKKILYFFDNPNGNDESFEQILRKLVDSILEIDAGVLVKVFNRGGQFSQVFAFDGTTFLKNPDIHGYMGNREEFVWPVESYFSKDFLAGTKVSDEVVQLYENMFRENAAYFQYGWTASAMPVPFGRREVVYMMNNPRTDTIYGTSPIEVLAEVILTLVYGSKYNLDFYVNNNMPDGIIQLIDANQPQIEAFRARFETQFKETDAFGQYKRKFHSYPIVNKDAKFTQFQLSAEQMQIIEQQQWFIKLVWACFGMTGSEMGFTEDSNRATEMIQSKVFKRKSLVPLLNLIEYHINTQIMPEFEAPMYEFKFDHYDIDEDLKKMQLYQTQISMGVKTAEMVAEEIGVDVTKLKEQKLENQAAFGVQQQGGIQNGFNSENKETVQQEKEDKDKEGYKEPESRVEEKFFKIKKPEETDFEKLIKQFYSQIEQQAVSIVESLNRDQLKQIGIRTEIKGLPEEVMKKVDGLFEVTQFEPVVQRQIKEQFLKGLEQAGKELNMNFIPNQNAIDFLTDYTFKNIKGLNTELKERLRKAISQGILNKESPTQIKARVKDALNLADPRIEAIGRTETHRALNQGRLEGAMQSKLKLKKKWSSHIDERTSPMCKALNGKIVALDEKFKFEGEEVLTAPGHVNCRSRVTFIQE